MKLEETIRAKQTFSGPIVSVRPRAMLWNIRRVAAFSRGE